MKILFITGSLNQGGAEFQILQLTKLFKDNGHQVEVFAITDYDFYKPFVKKNSIKYSHLLNSQSKLKRLCLTSKKIKEEQPDVIISYLKVPSQVALLAKTISRVKSTLIISERTSLVQPIYDKFHFFLMQFANSITVNSVVRFNQLKKDFPRLREKLFFFPNIIDLEKFKKIEKNYKLDIVNIGFVGRISPEKNVDKLIEAIKVIHKENCNTNLLIYGDSRNEEYLIELKSFVKANKLEEVVTFKGKIINVLEAYKNIDLLCLISNYEGFSNVLSEALCCGLPIITSNIEENKFLIEDKVNGFVVNQADPNDIAVGIKHFLELNDKDKFNMSIINRTKAEKIFNKKEIYKDYLKVINLFKS